MGGSAISGDLTVAALGDRATRPISVVRGYALESWTPPGQPFCARATPGDRGDAGLEAAGAAGARHAATAGGTLAEVARAEGVPVVGDAGGHAAARRGGLRRDGRDARCTALCGAGPTPHAEIGCLRRCWSG